LSIAPGGSRRTAPAQARVDLRSWIDGVRALGKLKEVTEASWELEIGALTDLNVKGPKWTLLFDRVRDYPAGFRVLTGALLDAGRVTLTFGLKPGLDDVSLVQALRGRLGRDWQASVSKVRATTVTDSPVFANHQRGAEVDLLRFTAPLWHEHDGGRYRARLTLWDEPGPMVERDEDSRLEELAMSRGIVNACRPLKRSLRGDFPAVVESSPEMREAVRAKWSWLFGQ
jgi:hypothetical protein